jgi:hypothetical protein
MNWGRVRELLELDEVLNTRDILRDRISAERRFQVDRRERLVAAIERMYDIESEQSGWLVTKEG